MNYITAGSASPRRVLGKVEGLRRVAFTRLTAYRESARTTGERSTKGGRGR